MFYPKVNLRRSFLEAGCRERPNKYAPSDVPFKATPPKHIRTLPGLQRAYANAVRQALFREQCLMQAPKATRRHQMMPLTNLHIY